MANFTVTYLFNLRDKFTAKARKIAAESNKAKKSVHNLGASFNGVERGANRAGNAISRLAHKMRSLKTVGRGFRGGGMMGLAGGFGGMMGVKSMLTRYADFQEAEIFARALGKELGQTKKQMDGLVGTARKLGSTTMFEPQDVLKGGGTFLKAGRSAAEAVAALPRALTLAAVSETSVEKATNSVLSIMAQAKIPASELGKTIDNLAATFMGAKAEMGELAHAAGYLLPTLAPLGVSMEQQFAILGTLSEAGQSGSKGARGFSMMISQIKKAPFMKKQAGLMKQYGLNLKDFFDDTGKIKKGNIIPLLQKLQAIEKTSKGTFLDNFLPANAAKIAKSFFSQFKTMDKILGLMANFEGAADRVAASKFKGINGAMRQLSAGWSELSIVFGEGGIGSRVEAIIRRTTKALSDMGKAFSALSPDTRSWISSLAIVAGILAAAVIPLGLFAMMAGALVPAIAGLAGGFAMIARLSLLPFFAAAGAFLRIMMSILGGGALFSAVGRIALAFASLKAGLAGAGVGFAGLAATLTGGGVMAALGTMLFYVARLVLGFSLIGAAVVYWRELSEVVKGFFSTLSTAYQGSEVQAAVNWVSSALGSIASAVGEITGISFEGSGLEAFFNAGAAAARAMLNPIESIRKALGWIGGKLGLVEQGKAAAKKLAINPNSAQKMAGGWQPTRPTPLIPPQRTQIDVTAPKSITLLLPNGGVAGTIELGARKQGDASTSSAETETP